MPLLYLHVCGDVCVRQLFMLWFLFVHFVSHYYFGSHKMKGTARPIMFITELITFIIEVIACRHNLVLQTEAAGET